VKKIAKWSFLVIFVLSVTAMILAIHIRFPVHHLDIVIEHAGDLEPALIMAVIHAESTFRPFAESHRGAQGLMQLMPPTATWMAQQMGNVDFDPNDVWKPEVNIAIGSFYLNWLVNYYHGNIDLALAAYNAGLGNVNSWLANPAFSHDGLTLHSIPFPETYNYLRRVRLRQNIYTILIRLHSIRR